MQESSSRMPLTKVRATVLGLVHLLNTCASVWRFRYDVVGKAVTPKNARHRERTASRNMVTSCALGRRVGRGGGEVPLAARKGFWTGDLKANKQHQETINWPKFEMGRGPPY